MDILFSTDNNYVMPTGVLMHSIGCNNKISINYHILVNQTFDDKCKKSLERIAEKYNSKVFFYEVNPDKLKELPFGRENQAKLVSIETYNRLFVTELLPKEIHKILYLDGDIIVRKPLVDLWQTNIDNVAAAVCHDEDELSHCNSGRLPYPMELGYFNAGVMLINLDYWRSNQLLNKFMSFAKENYDIIKLHDQDILNSVLCNQLKWLPLTYNFETGLIAIPSFEISQEMKKEVDSTKNDPAIIHYVSIDKPWRINCYNPYCFLWRKYWRKSEWKNTPLQNQEERTSYKDKILDFFYRRGFFIPIREYEKIKLD